MKQPNNIIRKVTEVTGILFPSVKPWHFGTFRHLIEVHRLPEHKETIMLHEVLTYMLFALLCNSSCYLVLQNKMNFIK